MTKWPGTDDSGSNRVLIGPSFPGADNAPNELVTEEMLKVACAAAYEGQEMVFSVEAALRAVAPMIAARAVTAARLDRCVCTFDKDGNLAGACMEHSVWRDEAVAAEREACAKLGREFIRTVYENEVVANDLYEAIRAKGEKAPERIYDATKHAIHLKVEADNMHRELLRQCAELMGAEAGTREARDLARISAIVADYEEVRWNIDKATTPRARGETT